MLVFGTKYQKYEGDKSIVIRAKEPDIYSSDKACVIKDNEIINISSQEILDEYIRINPDAFMNIFITELDAKTDNVYIYTTKMSTIMKKENNLLPDIVTTARSVNFDKTMSVDFTKEVFFGESISSLSTDDMYKYLFKPLVNNKSIYSFKIALYVNDTIDDIISIISNDDKINNALKTIDDSIRSIEQFVDTDCHIATNLKELLELSDYISNYRRIFNIVQVDWQVDLGEESYNKDGDLILNSKQIQKLQDLIRKNVTNITVLEYDADIDVNKIVSYSHCMISDSAQKIYLIAYDVISDYIEDTSDNSDVINAMLKTLSKDI